MWVLLSLFAGLCDSFRDASSKRWSGSLPKLLISWAYNVGALPFFLPLLWTHYPGPLPLHFWGLLVFVGFCHLSGGILLVRALSSSDLSLCIPMGAFSPVFLLFTAPFITGDLPSTAGVLGALLVVVGSYLLNLPELKDGVFAPFKALLRDSGVRIMLFLAFLWSITGCVDSIAVRRYDPLFWGSAEVTFISILFLPVLFWKKAFSTRPSRGQLAKLVIIGCFNGFSFWGYIGALLYAPVYYVICVKRLSILFSVLLGHFLFKERGLSGRLLGGIFMLAGVVIISLFG